MKKVFSIWSMVVLTTLCVGFSSCSDDDEGGSDNYKDYGYLEITINGTTYKQNDILGISGDVPFDYSKSYYLRDISKGFIETPDVDIYMYLIYYQNQTNFKNAKAGDFRISDDFSSYKNFDIEITAGTQYEYVSGGKHTVSNVKLLSTDSKSGILTYLVEGTFSCSFKHNANDKTLEMSGKYWTKLDVNPESKS
jgi:hypothetical protein